MEKRNKHLCCAFVFGRLSLATRFASMVPVTMEHLSHAYEEETAGPMKIIVFLD